MGKVYTWSVSGKMFKKVQSRSCKNRSRMDRFYMSELPAPFLRAAAGLTSQWADALFSAGRHLQGLAGGKRLRLGGLSQRSSPELTGATLVEGLSGEGCGR